MATHIHHRQRKPKKICAPELPLTKQHYLLFHGLFLCSQPKVTAIFRSIMLKPSGNPNGIYPTWCSFLCHFADVGLCSMFASNSAWIFGSGWIGVGGFLCVCRPDVLFCTVKKDGCAPLRGQLSMNNGSGSTMMLEIRCQLVYLMPGVQRA